MIPAPASDDAPAPGAAPKSAIAGRVLVVEDDEVSRRFLEFALARKGHAVTGVADAADAQAQVAAAGIQSFDCVVSDYRLPGRSGLDLLARLKEHDPGLAVIIVTAEGEKALVAESLRAGAADFLDKPVELARLHAAVAGAVERTRRQRRLAKSESDVKQLGRVQECMLGADEQHSRMRLDLCFHPKHEAGGDFFSRYQPTPGELFCFLTDVSGHDLQAAYLSAYFQGVVRGMLERGAPVQEIFTGLNRLLEEWNGANTFGRPRPGLDASVAACAIAIRLSARTATVITQGTPAPVYYTPDGNAQPVGQNGGFPLGWFPDGPVGAVIVPVAHDGAFCLWTDGLEALADRKAVSPLSLAFALGRAKQRHERLPGIDSAPDDILVAHLHLSPNPAAAGTYHPLFLQAYSGDRAGEIDQFQASWQRSLALAIPELPEARLHDILLASREAVLNALLHGCGRRGDHTATFQIAFCPQTQTVRVRAEDPGPGHQFQLPCAESAAARELRDGQRGLLLMQNLARTLRFERHGASLLMDFTWPSPTPHEPPAPS